MAQEVSGGGAFRRKHHPPILEAERERGQGVEGEGGIGN